jgi:hypothetical protein
MFSKRGNCNLIKEYFLHENTGEKNVKVLLLKI